MEKQGRALSLGPIPTLRHLARALKRIRRTAEKARPITGALPPTRVRFRKKLQGFQGERRVAQMRNGVQLFIWTSKNRCFSLSEKVGQNANRFRGQTTRLLPSRQSPFAAKHYVAFLIHSIAGTPPPNIPSASLPWTFQCPRSGFHGFQCWHPSRSPAAPFVSFRAKPFPQALRISA